MPQRQDKIVYTANPRGFCAGVERAIDIVELALKIYGSPIYVKHAIVHNTHVMRRLEAKGVTFTDDIESIPEGARVIFSAHGSPPSHFERAREKGLHIIDATCPLVTKVHLEVKRYAREGKDILMIGHKGHVEPVGTLGNAEGVRTYLIDSADDAASIEVKDPEQLAVVTQTTLSLDETHQALEILQKRFPHAVFPQNKDICYATTNRQTAIKELLPLIQALIVVGSTTSSNSNRLREVGERAGRPSYLIDDVAGLKVQWLEGIAAVGVSSGASVPDDLVAGVVQKLETLGYRHVSDKGKFEEVAFSLPRDLVQKAEKAASAEKILEKHTTTGKRMRV